jgi:MFS family permease
MSTATATQEIKVYGYRWVVLLTFMFISLVMQIFWICYAPITGLAAAQYGVSDFAIALLGILFMIIYLFTAYPASWAIDTWGLKKAVSLGAIMMAVFGLGRGIFTQSYTAALIFTIGLAAAQPLFLNAGTKLAANWFPLKERATVIGIGAVAPLLGIVIGQIATPILVEASSLSLTMLIYGILGVVSALVFLLFARDHPPSPAGFEQRVLMTEGLKRIVGLRDFWLLAFITFVINAIFNGIEILVEVIVRPKGMDITQAGLIGGILMIGGIVGVIVIPPFSDRMHKRKPALMFCLLASLPFLVLMAPIQNFTLLAIDSFLLGLFVMGSIPISLQYCTEICYPAPEGTSAGAYTMAGQIAGLVITVSAASIVAIGFTPSMLVLVVATVVSAVFLGMMNESKMIQQAPAVEISPEPTPEAGSTGEALSK